jgi:VanZ family protein
MPRVQLRFATGLATIIVLAAVLWPSDGIPKVPVAGIDKAVHMLLFGAWALALRFDWRLFRKRPGLLIAAAGIFGILTEILQLLAPGRSPDPLDVAADLAGAALAAVAGGPVVRLADRLSRPRRHADGDR